MLEVKWPWQASRSILFSGRLQDGCVQLDNLAEWCQWTNRVNVDVGDGILNMVLPLPTLPSDPLA